MPPTLEVPDDVLKAMKSPGQYREKIWRGRVLQIKWGTPCNLACANCTAEVNHIKEMKRGWWMTPNQLRLALRSLKGFAGVIGAFGGNCCMHPQFEEMCQVLVEEVPDKDQRGLWSNNLCGHGKLCREVFSPSHSNLNVHQVQRAYDEIARDWPEAIAARPQFMHDSLHKPSMHGSWRVALQDVIPDERKRWDLIKKCDVNQTWSAEITLVHGELRAFFCEYAATRGELHDVYGEEDVGLPLTDGWWAKPMEFFSKQICHHCHKCGAPLKPEKIRDLGKEPEEWSETSVGLFAATQIPNRRLDANLAYPEGKEGHLVGSAPSTGYLEAALAKR